LKKYFFIHKLFSTLKTKQWCGLLVWGSWSGH